MATVTAEIQLRCMIRHDVETGAFVSHCPDLNLYSGGNTELEAMEAMKSAITLFADWAFERGELGHYLLRMGMRYATKLPEAHDFVSVGGSEDSEQTIPIHVPFYLVAQAAGHAGA